MGRPKSATCNVARPSAFSPPEENADDRTRTDRAAQGQYYQRRNEDGSFGESDDQTKSLSQDAHQHAQTEKPRNEGDKGD